MRSIVRTVLLRVAALGRLPGDHHFYIAFDTRAPGVGISKRLKQKYPEEMTIVLQHQFSNLMVNDTQFEVTLSFGNVPERLTVPLQAIRVFFDPSVPYGLQFDSSDLVGSPADEPGPRAIDGEGAEALPGATESPAGDGAAEPLEPAALATKVRSRKSRSGGEDRGGDLPAPAVVDSVTETVGASMARRQPGRPKLVTPKPDEPANDAKVVQLDKFRKR
jgi:hypothetical protein